MADDCASKEVIVEWDRCKPFIEDLVLSWVYAGGSG